MLYELFELSINTGVVPKDMLVGRVTSPFKKGDPMNVQNFKPISVLPILSKVLEKLIYKRVMNHLEHNNYLTDSQYGFRSQCCTEGALKDICAIIYNSFENAHYCLGAFLYLSKTFDSLDRGILLRKLDLYMVLLVMN